MYPSNPNPPNASFVVLPEAPLVNELVVFDASQSTDEGLDCQLTCTFTWDFGDGSSGSGVTVTHRYTSPGGKVVRLTVADANGATTTLARTITVHGSGATDRHGVAESADRDPIGRVHDGCRGRHRAHEVHLELG